MKIFLHRVDPTQRQLNAIIDLIHEHGTAAAEFVEIDAKRKDARNVTVIWQEALPTWKRIAYRLGFNPKDKRENCFLETKLI